MTTMPPDAARPGRDPGLQGERTSLAWNRTGLALSVNALLVLRTGWHLGYVALSIVGALLLVLAAAAVVYGNVRGRALSGHTPHHEPPAAPSLAVAGIAVATLIACAGCLASVLISH